MTPVTRHERIVALARDLSRLGESLASARTHRRATALADVSLERPALQVIGVLASAGQPCRIGEIADDMQVEAPHVTRLVQRLERDGLVARVVDQADRRARLVDLTPRGAEIARRYQDAVVSWLGGAFSQWNAADLESLLDLTERAVGDLLQLLGEQDPGARPSRRVRER